MFYSFEESTHTSLTNGNLHFTELNVIENFRHKGFRRLYENGDRRGLPPELIDRIGVILADLEVARQIFRSGSPRLQTAFTERRSEGILVDHNASQLADHISVRGWQRVRC
jgi:hypothetical protein